MRSAIVIILAFAASAFAQNIVLKDDREANALSVSRAMSAAAEAGISDIAFSAVNRD